MQLLLWHCKSGHPKGPRLDLVNVAQRRELAPIIRIGPCELGGQRREMSGL